MLWMFRRVMFGPLNNEKNKDLKDLSIREISYLLPLTIMIFVMGIFPNYFLNKITPTVEDYLDDFKAKTKAKVVLVHKEQPKMIALNHKGGK